MNSHTSKRHVSLSLPKQPDTSKNVLQLCAKKIRDLERECLEERTAHIQTLELLHELQHRVTDMSHAFHQNVKNRGDGNISSSTSLPTPSVTRHLEFNFSLSPKSSADSNPLETFFCLINKLIYDEASVRQSLILEELFLMNQSLMSASLRLKLSHFQKPEWDSKSVHDRNTPIVRSPNYSSDWCSKASTDPITSRFPSSHLCASSRDVESCTPRRTVAELAKTPSPRICPPVLNTATTEPHRLSPYHTAYTYSPCEMERMSEGPTNGTKKMSSPPSQRHFRLISP